jgi:hypothetical protein
MGRGAFLACAGALALATSGCGGNAGRGDGGGGGNRDLTFTFNEVDLAGSGTDDGGEQNACGDFDPSCVTVGMGPGTGMPFPLPSDMPADPNADASGVSRDKNGYLGLDSTHASFDYVYAANTSDWNRGTVSKFNSKTVREVARYYSVTCNSLKSGNRNQCDGMSGCCARDSYPQFQNRKNNQAQGPYQQVNLGLNYPSRTTVDFNGDLWVANRAFGGQSSVSKIANDPVDCIDRNGNGKIDTSRDANGDGLIQTDCNNNNVADDLQDVKNTPCANGAQEEFFGLDDECILFTTNTGPSDQWGRPLSLGPGAQDFGPSDAWAGTYQDGHYYRVDGATGITKDMAALPGGCHPYGAVVDSSSVLWTGNLGSGLCYLDTKKPANTATARQPQGIFESGYGIALDRDQNIWLSSGSAYRYTPDRKMGWQSLGNGYWTAVQSPGANAGGGSGLGIAADSRSPNAFFVYTCGGQSVIQIPASTIPLPMGMDTQVNGAAFPAVRVAGSSKGCGVSVDQNVFSVGQGTAVITRVVVDAMGKMAPPDINSAPMGNNKCPAGDRCEYKDAAGSNPSPYTYSDFTGFGLRNFTRPKGFYTYVFKGCVDPNTGMPTGDTEWKNVTWDADVPLNTSITLKARSGPTPKPDLTWGQWTPDFALSPADLVNGMPLVPNNNHDMPANYLQVEFDFTTMDKNANPKLKAFQAAFECHNILG